MEETQLFYDSLTINIIPNIDGHDLKSQQATFGPRGRSLLTLAPVWDADVTTITWIVEAAGEASTYRLLRPSHFHSVILFVVKNKESDLIVPACANAQQTRNFG